MAYGLKASSCHPLMRRENSLAPDCKPAVGAKIKPVVEASVKMAQNFKNLPLTSIYFLRQRGPIKFAFAFIS